MRIATVEISSQVQVIAFDSDFETSGEYALASDLFEGEEFQDCMGVIERHAPHELSQRWSSSKKRKHPLSEVRFLPPYREPEMIWGIGLNYVDHAADLSATAPGDEPASFIKGRHTIIGADDEIIVPRQSERTTAEAELGIIVGKVTRKISPLHALDHLFGVVPVLDQTAEDILQRNPRFLTRSKNFPTFFAFGPWIVTIDEVINKFDTLERIKVATFKNGELHRENFVSNMTFSPAHLLAFHSEVFPLQPGDIISTGTPGAVVIEDGDRVECRIEGIGTLTNRVRRESRSETQSEAVQR